MSFPPTVGRYRIDRVLGSGAFASVWLGHDDALDSQVAIKVLSGSLLDDLDVRNRFLEEARILRRADSERLVRVHDIGELPDGRPYFVMSYADRGTLADRMRMRPLPVSQALVLAEEIAYGVEVINTLGVIHRDLKPSNVLFQSTPDGGEKLLIADLGLAKALAHASGAFTLPVGTPGYMSPEQARFGGGLDVRADVYGLGALTYHMLTGRPPGTAPVRVAPSEIRDELPPAFDEVVLRAMEMEREKRWPTAAAFASALATLRPTMPPGSRPAEAPTPEPAPPETPPTPSQAPESQAPPPQQPPSQHAPPQKHPSQQPAAQQPGAPPGVPPVATPPATIADQYPPAPEGHGQPGPPPPAQPQPGQPVPYRPEDDLPTREDPPESEDGVRTSEMRVPQSRAPAQGPGAHTITDNPDQTLVDQPPGQGTPGGGPGVPADGEHDRTVIISTPSQAGGPPPPIETPQPPREGTTAAFPTPGAFVDDPQGPGAGPGAPQEATPPNFAPAPPRPPKERSGFLSKLKGKSGGGSAQPGRPQAPGAGPPLPGGGAPAPGAGPPIPGGGPPGAGPPAPGGGPQMPGGPMAPGGGPPGGPSAPGGGGRNKALLPLLIGGGAFALVLIIVLVLVTALSGDDKPEPPPKPKIPKDFVMRADPTGKIRAAVPKVWPQGKESTWLPTDVSLNDAKRRPVLRATPSVPKFLGNGPSPGVFIGMTTAVAPGQLPPPSAARHTQCKRSAPVKYTSPDKALTGTITRFTGCSSGTPSVTEIGLRHKSNKFGVWIRIKETDNRNIARTILDSLQLKAP